MLTRLCLTRSFFVHFQYKKFHIYSKDCLIDLENVLMVRKDLRQVGPLCFAAATAEFSLAACPQLLLGTT